MCVSICLSVSVTVDMSEIVDMSKIVDMSEIVDMSVSVTIGMHVKDAKNVQDVKDVQDIQNIHKARTYTSKPAISARREGPSTELSRPKKNSRDKDRASLGRSDQYIGNDARLQ